MTVSIECDNAIDCGSMVTRGDLSETIAYARAKGWHMYQGKSLTGKYIDVKLCPSCIGTSRSRLPPAPLVLDGQLELELWIGGSDE